MRPFSRRRNGFVAGEGAAAVVLERGETTHVTEQPVIGRLIGAAECCQSCSPVKYPTDPIPMARAVESIGAAVNRDPAAVAFVNSAANSTRSLDACEAETLRLIARQLGRRENDLPVLAALVALEAGICPPLPFDADALDLYDPEFDYLRLSYWNAPAAVTGSDFIHLASAAGGHQVALWLTGCSADAIPKNVS
jgi:hypothetical protein